MYDERPHKVFNYHNDVGFFCKFSLRTILECGTNIALECDTKIALLYDLAGISKHNEKAFTLT